MLESYYAYITFGKPGTHSARTCYTQAVQNATDPDTFVRQHWKKSNVTMERGIHLQLQNETHLVQSHTQLQPQAQTQTHNTAATTANKPPPNRQTCPDTLNFCAAPVYNGGGDDVDGLAVVIAIVVVGSNPLVILAADDMPP